MAYIYTMLIIFLYRHVVAVSPGSFLIPHFFKNKDRPGEIAPRAFLLSREFFSIGIADAIKQARKGEKHVA